MKNAAVACAAIALVSACSSSSSPPKDVAPDIPPGCNLPVVPAVLPSGQVLTLGTHKVGDVVTFTVPAGTQSLTILQQAVKGNLHVVYKNQVQDNSAVPLTLFQPDGGKVYDDFADFSTSQDGGVDYSGRLSAYGFDSPVTAAFTIPNTTGGLKEMGTQVPAGTWTFTVNDYAYECATPSFGLGCQDGGSTNNTYDIQVVLKPTTAGKTLNVAIYLATSQINAATAQTSPRMQRFVASYKQLLQGGGGLTVNDPVFYDVSASDIAKYAVISDTKTDPCSNLDQLFTLSSAHPGNTVNLFFVSSIGTGGTVVGIDGAIPGPPGASGTVHSGAVVSAADLFAGSCTAGSTPTLTCGADFVAFTAAHETGHYLGLFHPTESSGAVFDPLDDTPKCPCLSCATATDLPNCKDNPPTDPKLEASLCTGAPAGCAGGQNLMFWQLSDGISTGVLTPQQGQVMQKNPLVQ